MKMAIRTNIHNTSQGLPNPGFIQEKGQKGDFLKKIPLILHLLTCFECFRIVNTIQYEWTARMGTTWLNCTYSTCSCNQFQGVEEAPESTVTYCTCGHRKDDHFCAPPCRSCNKDIHGQQDMNMVGGDTLCTVCFAKYFVQKSQLQGVCEIHSRQKRVKQYKHESELRKQKLKHEDELHEQKLEHKSELEHERKLREELEQHQERKIIEAIFRDRHNRGPNCPIS